MQEFADGGFMASSPRVAGESSLAHGLKFDWFTAGPAAGEMNVICIPNQPPLKGVLCQPRILEFTFSRHFKRLNELDRCLQAKTLYLVCDAFEGNLTMCVGGQTLVFLFSKMDIQIIRVLTKLEHTFSYQQIRL